MAVGTGLGPPCSACGKEVLGKCMRAEGVMFHPECFVCGVCQEPLGGPFSVKGGVRTCKKCLPPRLCGACDLPIEGTAAELGGCAYHPDCVKCDGCAEPLPGSFFVQGSRRLCGRCCSTARADAGAAAGTAAGTASRPVRTCAACGTADAGDFLLSPEGEAFHRECFVCQRCGVALEGSFRRDQDGRRVCSSCGLKRCEACGRPIEGAATTAGGRFFHAECFACAGCLAPLGAFVPIGGENFCPKCADTKSSSHPLCDKCGVPIAGEGVSTGRGHRFHPECFACAGCGATLGKTFFTRGEDGGESRYLCAPCSCAPEPEEPARKVGPRPCLVCRRPCLEASFELLDGSALHWGCFRCCGCGAPEPRPPKEEEESAVRLPLLRTRVLALAKGAHFCEACLARSRAAPPGPSVCMAATRAEADARAAEAAAAEQATREAEASEAARRRAQAAEAEAREKAERAAAAAAAAEAAARPLEELTLEELRDPRVCKAKEVDPARREQRLSDAAFLETFGMSKEAFAALPGWKREKAKKAHGLF